MRRGYTREAYLDLVYHVRDLVPEVALSSDFICGFCGETDEEFNDTLTLMEEVKYNVAYLFPYSLREVIKYFTLLLYLSFRNYISTLLVTEQNIHTLIKTKNCTYCNVVTNVMQHIKKCCSNSNKLLPYVGSTLIFV